MKTHPAILMLRVWVLCILAFYILPFELINRSLSLHGYLILAAFIAAFCVGTLFKTRATEIGTTAPALPSFHRSDWVMFGAAAITVLALGFEFASGNFLDLSDAAQERSERAGALLSGAQSQSSIPFQIAFLFYPASYVYTVRELAFRQSPNLMKLSLVGLLPVLMMALVMGGRGPLLLGLLLVALSFRLRKWTLRDDPMAKKQSSRSGRGFLLIVAVGVMMLVAMNYFAEVFLVRAEAVGGAGAMLDIAASVWGITFEGGRADILMATIGEGNTYLVFVFVWYLIQGLVMSNVLFTDYVGPPHFGIYGVDLASALMRRLNGDFVADRFYSLMELNTYGFFPSAFGSLYVDAGLIGLAICAIWGYLATLVYRKCRERTDARWLLLAPFVTLGIILSLINTPVGFNNGLVTHFWMIVIFLMTVKRTNIARVELISPTPPPGQGRWPAAAEPLSS